MTKTGQQDNASHEVEKHVYKQLEKASVKVLEKLYLQLAAGSYEQALEETEDQTGGAPE